mgnify:FL=1
MKYFLIQDVSRKVTSGNKVFNFTRTHRSLATGTDWGVIAVDGADADLLTKIAPKFGVKSISESEYAQYLAKKNSAPDYRTVIPLNNQLADPSLYSRVDPVAKPAEVTPAKAGSDDTVTSQVASVDDLLVEVPEQHEPMNDKPNARRGKPRGRRQK